MEVGCLRWALFLPLLTACAKPAAEVVSRPVYSVGYEETGEAAWYSHPSQGRRAARGEVYDLSQMTGAHPILPLGSWVAVENLLSGRAAEVQITDRTPFTARPSLHLSPAAARALGALAPGVIPVRLRVIALPGSTLWTGSGSLSVHVASFTSEYRAQVLKEILEQAWAGAYVQRAEAGGQTFYRVRVGTYSTRREARRQALRLAAAGYPVIVMEE